MEQEIYTFKHDPRIVVENVELCKEETPQSYRMMLDKSQSKFIASHQKHVTS